MSKHHFLPCTHTDLCMLISSGQLLPVLITTHNTINGYETTVLNWKALYVAMSIYEYMVIYEYMSIMVCLEEQVMFSQKNH